MAKAADAEESKRSTGGITILGVLLLSGMGIAAGLGFGFVIPGLMKESPVKPKPAEPAAQHGPTLPPTAILKTLAPLTTNLARPTSTWIRIESSIVIEKDMGPDADIIAARLSEDLIGYLRTVTVDQLEGPSGFQHLREDLNDRVRVRTEGKASELIIQSLIIE